MVGVGNPKEATYSLPGPIPAGDYHLIGDGITTSMPDVQFDILWRRAGAADSTIVSFTHQYPAGSASQYEETKSVPAVSASAGDVLVMKVSMLGTDMNAEYIPISEHPQTPTARFLQISIP